MTIVICTRLRTFPLRQFRFRRRKRRWVIPGQNCCWRSIPAAAVRKYCTAGMNGYGKHSAPGSAFHPSHVHDYACDYNTSTVAPKTNKNLLSAVSMCAQPVIFFFNVAGASTSGWVGTLSWEKAAKQVRVGRLHRTIPPVQPSSARLFPQAQHSRHSPFPLLISCVYSPV